MNILLFPIVGAEQALPVYLVSVGGHSRQSPIKREGGLPNFQILYTAAGSGTLRVEGAAHTLGPGQGMLLYPHTPHEYHADAPGWETHWLTFDGSAAPALAAGLGFARSGVFTLPGIAAADELWKTLLRDANLAGPAHGSRCSADVYRLLMLFQETLGGGPREDGAATGARAALDRALALIDTDFARDLSLDELAAQGGVSPQYLCRLFQTRLGMRPFAYLAKRRLQEAKRLLSDSAAPVAVVAARCGFASPSYFCTVFRRYEGMTAADFRRMHRG